MLLTSVDACLHRPCCHTKVSARAASRREALPNIGRLKSTLDHIRITLGWDEVGDGLAPKLSRSTSSTLDLSTCVSQVPILRNRRRRFLIVESPWDDFGPPPPPSLDYRLDLDEH